MSVTTTLEERGRVARHRSMRAAENVVVGAMLRTTAWFWGSIVLVGIVIAVLQSRFGELDGSALQYTLGSTRWFMFTMGLILAIAVLPMHVAAGGTRRAFVDGFIRGALFIGLVTGLVTATVLLVERLVWGALGWDWHFGQGLAPDGSFVITAASEALVIATYVLTGGILPAAYQRLGAWGGSFMIVALLAAMFFADWSVHTGYIFGWEVLTDTGAGRVPLGLAGGALAVAVAALGADRFYRGIPLRPTIA